MFKILDGREHFYQWDLNQKIVVNDASIKEVHFCNKTDDCALVVEVKEGLAEVPNILLQDNYRIRVYAYTGEYTKVEGCFKITPRSKPADYVYTETEIKSLDALEKRMDALEGQTIPQEIVDKAINDYFVVNPIETGATEAEAAQIEENKKDIAALEKAAEGYALKSEIPSIEGLASTDYVDNAIEAIHIPTVDLTEYAKAADIPTKVSELTNDKGYLTAIPAEYITETELNDKGYLTSHQDISGKADKATTLGGYGITDAATKDEIKQIQQTVNDLKNNTSVGEDGFSIYGYNGNFGVMNIAVEPDWSDGDEYYYVSDVNIPTDRDLQVGDLLIDTVGNIVSVTSVYDVSEVMVFDFELFTTIGGGSGATIEQIEQIAKNTEDIGKLQTTIDGKKSAYETAQDGGYLGTEEEFAEKLAIDYIDWFGKGISIPKNSDLDTYTTNGKYFVANESTAKTLLNSPTTTNFCMYVFERTGAPSQLLIALNGKMFIRGKSSTSWRDWKGYVTTEEIETLTATIKQELLENIDGTVDYVVAEAEEVLNRVINAQKAKTFNMAVITDLHNNGGVSDAQILHACQGIGYIADRIKLDAFACLGDHTEASGISDWTECVKDIIDCNNHKHKVRNVDYLELMGNHDFKAKHSPMTSKLISSFTKNVVWGNELGGYFHRDYEEYKLRIIGVNTSEAAWIGVTEEQYKWFIDTIDLSEKEDASEWQILILSHVPLDFNTFTVFSYVLNAYVKGTTWTDGTYTCDYTGKNKATIIGNVHGHIHNLLVDRMYLGNPTVSTEQINVWRFTIPEVTELYNNHYEAPWKHETSYSKAANTAKDTSFNILSIDLDNKKIDAICYGAGVDRVINYTVFEEQDEPSTPNYTNLADTTLATDTTLTPTSEGWIENKRVNSSFALVDADGYHISNIVDIGDKETIRIKGFNLTGTYGRIYFIQSGNCYYYIDNANEYMINHTDGDYTEITRTTLKAFLSANGKATDFDSFRVGGALSGTKEDVIITLDEPIQDGATPTYTNLYNTSTMATSDYLNKRINSSGNYVDASGYYSTPFIELPTPTSGEIKVRVKGYISQNVYERLILYKSANNDDIYFGDGSTPTNSASMWAYTYDSTNDIYTFTAEVGTAVITHIRFTFYDTSKVNNVIVTVNEVIQ